MLDVWPVKRARGRDLGRRGQQQQRCNRGEHLACRSLRSESEVGRERPLGCRQQRVGKLYATGHA